MNGSIGQAGIQGACDSGKDACSYSAQRVIRMAVPPAQTVSLRLRADSELRSEQGGVWATRILAPYDHWIQPGAVLRLKRGERIWLGNDGDATAQVSLTSAFAVGRKPAFAWVERMREYLADIALLRSR
jgi:hypothetical protein